MRIKRIWFNFFELIKINIICFKIDDQIIKKMNRFVFVFVFIFDDLMLNFSVEIKFDSKMKFLIFKFFNWIISLLLNVINRLTIDFVTHKTFFLTLKLKFKWFSKKCIARFYVWTISIAIIRFVILIATIDEKHFIFDFIILHFIIVKLHIIFMCEWSVHCFIIDDQKM